MVNVNQKICLFNYLLWLTLQETSRGCIQKYPPYPESVIHKCPPNSEIRAFVQLEHRGMKCTFVTASEKGCVYAVCLHQEIVFFTKCYQCLCCPWDTGSDQGFWTLALHLRCLQTEMCFCKKDGMLWDKIIPQPNQPKSLQAVEQVIEMYKRLWRMWH